MALGQWNQAFSCNNFMMQIELHDADCARVIYDIGYHYHLGGRHYDYSQICSLPFMGDKRFIESWDVQWLGDVTAFCFVTGAGVGGYHSGSVAGFDYSRHAGDGEHVVSRTVTAFSIIAILSGAFGGYGRSIDAQLILRGGVSTY
ncbi:Uncharacterised protein [Yersinia thracica]|uniref:Uncharacterized protein n=1 Tax=Yersinia thracica TaxID=2890319 RepID=A0A0T9P9R7_9GAMM|nr:Uncharacterised protein [Yersinia thracica]